MLTNIRRVASLAWAATLPLLLPMSAQSNDASPDLSSSKTESIVLGAGCFWCVEAVMQRVEGVKEAVSGYMGGDTKDPTYREVCSGTTGHAEVVKVEFDPSKITLDEILEIFWIAHDPTTLNRQGADVGTQYRSAIFYENEEQRKTALASREKADKSGRYADPIVTEITPASEFYEAEDYHQEFYDENPQNQYCRYVIHPKLKKLGMAK